MISLWLRVIWRRCRSRGCLPTAHCITPAGKLQDWQYHKCKCSRGCLPRIPESHIGLCSIRQFVVLLWRPLVHIGYCWRLMHWFILGTPPQTSKSATAMVLSQGEDFMKVIRVFLVCFAPKACTCNTMVLRAMDHVLRWLSVSCIEVEAAAKALETLFEAVNVSKRDNRTSCSERSRPQ